MKGTSINYLILLMLFLSCKPAARLPKTYQDLINDYEAYHIYNGCKSGETIASIGAGNGIKEIQISCFVEDITWFIQEIDSSKLSQFPNVLAYHKNLKGSPIKGTFELVLGTETSTGLPEGIFNRVLMINVFHELESREAIMKDVQALLKEDGVLVIMERMADKEGAFHGDCKYQKLIEHVFLKEMEEYGYSLKKKALVEKFSNLTFFTFSVG
jgi:SAM-dependent methyltransferase